MPNHDRDREFLVGCVQHAHAMEITAADLMESQLKRIDNYPDLQARISQHVEETRRQAERLERALDSLGSSRSTMKDVSGRFASLNAMMDIGADDEVLRHHTASYALEHFEIGTYRALAALADGLGEPEVARVARENLAEEERMASWLDERLQPTSEQFLDRWRRGGKGEAAA